MFHPEKLGELLAKSGMLDEEKQAWMKLLPSLPLHEIATFQKILENEAHHTAKAIKVYERDVRRIDAHKEKDTIAHGLRNNPNIQ